MPTNNQLMTLYYYISLNHHSSMSVGKKSFFKNILLFYCQKYSNTLNFLKTWNISLSWKLNTKNVEICINLLPADFIAIGNGWMYPLTLTLSVRSVNTDSNKASVGQSVSIVISKMSIWSED